MNRPSEIVSGTAASIETYVDGHGPAVVIIPSYGRDEWGDLRSHYGNRITTTVIGNAGHALFPEQPGAVADAVSSYLRAMTW